MKIKDRLAMLRKYMKEKAVDWFYCKDGDPHFSEYVDVHYSIRTYFSGFTGSNGSLLVGSSEAYLWTDGRYFVQAEKELEGTGITLFKMGVKDVPTFLEFIEENVKRGETLGLDGMVFSAAFGKELQRVLSKNDASLKADVQVPNYLWENRPAASARPVWVLEQAYAGECARDKIKKVQKQMKEKNVTAFLLSKLDDIMWLTNLRGDDIECNPVAYSYLFLTNNTCHLFLKEEAVRDAVAAYLDEEGIIVHAYEDIVAFILAIKRVEPKEHLWCHAENVSTYLYSLLERTYDILDCVNPTEMMKAVKNDVEIRNLKDAYLADSVVVTRFIKYIKEQVTQQKISETQAANYLDGLRRELPDFLELSFPTISAYGPNAAMMHYSAKEGQDAILKTGGIYLVDSGGQYKTGTTDVTRSIVLGEISEEIKAQYTRVTRGNLQLLNAKFLKGCSGRNLDILARQPLWDVYEDYKCGTGHGIGQVLNVHEGPHYISWNKRRTEEEVPLTPGMIVSDEPGIYITGSHGIRIETILLCVSELENENGQYYGFVPLTFVPIDLKGILPEALTSRERKWLNEYHALVYEKIAPFFTEEEKMWLKEQTKMV